MLNEQTTNVLKHFWQTGELPTVETKVVFDDASIIKIVLALVSVILVAYILFGILSKK